MLGADKPSLYDDLHVKVNFYHSFSSFWFSNEEKSSHNTIFYKRKMQTKNVCKTFMSGTKMLFIVTATHIDHIATTK